MVESDEPSKTRKPTRAMRSLLAVLMDPHNWRRTVRKKCEVAGISERRYYDLMADEQFRELAESTFRAGLMDQAFAVRKALIDSARMPMYQASGDRRLFFEMLGVVKSQQELKHSGSVRTSPAQLVIIESLPSIPSGSADDAGPDEQAAE